MSQYSPNELEAIEEARRELGPLLAIVRQAGSYWHRTSVDSLRQILTGGGLEPNDGRFPTTYGQSRDCMARHLGAVSLFDFNTRPVEE